MKEAMTELRLNILEHEHQAMIALKPMADLVVDKSYQVVTLEEHQKGLHS